MYPITAYPIVPVVYLLLQGSHMFGALLSSPAGWRPHRVRHMLRLGAV